MQNDAFDRDGFTNELLRIDTSRYEEATWEPNRIDRFKAVVEAELTKAMSDYQHAVVWDVGRGDSGVVLLKLTVRTRDWGQLSVDLPHERIRKGQVAKNLPQMLGEQFAINFKQKKAILVSKISNHTRKPKRRKD